jgi:hypothetical protein
MVSLFMEEGTKLNYGGMSPHLSFEELRIDAGFVVL